MGEKAPRALSIVDVFSRLPWQGYAASTVAPDVCLLALVVVPAPLVAMHGDVQSDSTLATTPGELTGVEQASPSPRCDEPAQLSHV
jgi:hypothetical protein